MVEPEVKEGEEQKGAGGEEKPIVCGDGELKQPKGEGEMLKAVGVEEKPLVVCAEGEPKQRKGVGVEEPLVVCADGEAKQRKGVGGAEADKVLSVEADKETMAAIEDGSHAADDRKAVEERLAARYEIPVEVFTAASEGISGCILVSSLFDFSEAARAPHPAPVFLLPYLPPGDAFSIQAELEKEEQSLQPLIILNPELLASKLAAKRAIDTQEALLLAVPEEGSDDNKESREERRRASVERFSLALDLVTFRSHMRMRLVFAYTAQGSWAKARSFLGPLLTEEPHLPKDNKSSGYQVIQELQRRVKSLKIMYPYPDERDVSTLCADLISILSVDHWNEIVYRARGKDPLKAIESFRDAREQHSLIGASNITMALAAMKRGFNGLISFGIEKGRLSEAITIDSSTKSFLKGFRKISTTQINTLIDLLPKVKLNVDEISAAVKPLVLVATRLGAKGLKSKCDNLIAFCKQKDNSGWNAVLSKIETECSDLCISFDTILELQELIQLVEGIVKRAESGADPTWL